MTYRSGGAGPGRIGHPLAALTFWILAAATLRAGPDPSDPWTQLADALELRIPQALGRLLQREQGEYLRGLKDRDICPYAHERVGAAESSLRLQAALRSRILARQLSGATLARALGLLAHQLADQTGGSCSTFPAQSAEREIAESFSDLWLQLGGAMALPEFQPSPLSRRSAPRAKWTFTNRDLLALPPAPGASHVEADGLRAPLGNQPSEAPDAASRKRFATEARQLRARLKRQGGEVEQLESQLERIERERRQDPSARSSESAERRIRDQLGRAAASLQISRQELDALEQQARRAGLLPGDLRD
jgi:hypothetical protein